MASSWSWCCVRGLRCFWVLPAVSAAVAVVGDMSRPLLRRADRCGLAVAETNARAAIRLRLLWSASSGSGMLKLRGVGGWREEALISVGQSDATAVVAVCQRLRDKGAK